jgi:hypothetical protein
LTAVLLAFANDWIDDKRHLRSLLDEGKAIGKALGPAVKAGVDVLPPLHNATVSDVSDAFRDHHDQIRIFHFGGHASGSALLLEDETGHPTEAHAGGLAGYLGQQPGLVLVFLNGCSTEPQVRRLRAAGIKAVVATTQAIQDAVAAEFAEAFYAELAVRPLRSAFDTAVHALQMRCGDDPRAVTRDVVPHNEPHAPSWPWIIDCDPAYADWTLGAEVAEVRGRTRWQRLRLTAVAMLLLLSLLLLVSADARRTACRAPGLRSLCATIGTGDVTTAQEQALWEDARAQSTGDGLRAYLRTYPRGVHADEARSRLQTCSHVRVETLGSEREIRYPLNEIRMEHLATEQEARDDAQRRANKRAASECESLHHTSMILSTAAEVQYWKCTPLDGRFACGVQGEIVCRFRERIPSDQERCRDDGNPGRELPR